MLLLKYYLNYLMLPKTVEVNRNIANMTQYQLKYYLNATNVLLKYYLSY